VIFECIAGFQMPAAGIYNPSESLGFISNGLRFKNGWHRDTSQGIVVSPVRMEHLAARSLYSQAGWAIRLG
jgi:hypothetical protein